MTLSPTHEAPRKGDVARVNGPRNFRHVCLCTDMRCSRGVCRLRISRLKPTVMSHKPNTVRHFLPLMRSSWPLTLREERPQHSRAVRPNTRSHSGSSPIAAELHGVVRRPIDEPPSLPRGLSQRSQIPCGIREPPCLALACRQQSLPAEDPSEFCDSAAPQCPPGGRLKALGDD